MYLTSTYSKKAPSTLSLNLAHQNLENKKSSESKGNFKGNNQAVHEIIKTNLSALLHFNTTYTYELKKLLLISIIAPWPKVSNFFQYTNLPGPSLGRLLIQARSLFTALSRIFFSLFANFFAKCSSAPPAAIFVLDPRAAQAHTKIDTDPGDRGLMFLFSLKVIGGCIEENKLRGSLDHFSYSRNSLH